MHMLKEMKLTLEHINMATGICLCIAGVVYMIQQDYTSALSWGIFGAMYLVMDSYQPCPRAERTSSHVIREIFGVVGFVLSVVLLAYLFLA